MANSATTILDTAGVDASRRARDTARATADVARVYQADAMAASRALFTTWASSVDVVLRGAFDVQNASFDATITVYDRAAASYRGMLQQWANDTQQAQQTFVETWQSGVRAAERLAGEASPNGAAH